MPHQTGGTTSLVIGFESSYGVAPAAGFQLQANYGEDVRGSQAVNAVNTIRGNRNPAMPFRGNVEVSGSVPVPLDSLCFAHWLCAMFGDPVTSGAGPYEHEWKVPLVQPSFTYEKAFTDLTTDRFARSLGCKIDSLSLEAGGDGELVANLGIFGAQEQWDTSAFVGSPTAIALARVSNFNGTVEEGGATSNIITKVNLNLEFGLDKRVDIIPIANAGVRTDLPAGSMRVGGSVTAIFNDDGYTLLNKGIAGTESSLLVTFTAAADSIVEFEIEELQYSRSGVGIDTPEGLLVTLDFQAYYEDAAEQSAIVWRVTNDVTGYDLVP